MKSRNHPPPGPVLVLGASSAIARGACAELARRGHRLYLAGRRLDALERDGRDLHHRYGVTVEAGHFDATDLASHDTFIDDVDGRTGGLMGVVVAFGYLGEQARAVTDFSQAATIIAANFTGAASILTHAAERLRGRPGAFIIAISSVAADRGRKSNYVYGAAKAGLETFLSGLRNRLHGEGVRVLTIKPGFVDTPMTFGKEGMFLVADADDVGRRLIAALDGRRDVIYLPWFWQPIMQVIRLLPESLFKRLNL